MLLATQRRRGSVELPFDHGACRRCIELGWWFHFTIALFGVLFVAVVGLVVDSDFFSPRLWLSNGC